MDTLLYFVFGIVCNFVHFYPILITAMSRYGDDKKRFNAGLTNVIDMLHSDVMKRDWGRAAQTIGSCIAQNWIRYILKQFLK